MSDSPKQSHQKAKSTGVLKRVYQYVKPHKRKLALAVCLTIFMAVVSPVRPYLVQYVVDHYIIKPNGEMLLKSVGLMIFILMLETAVSYYSNYSINHLGQLVVRDLRNAVFKHLTRLKLAYFDRTPIGTLVTRVVNDLETISSIFTEGLAIIFGDLLQLTVVLTVMFYTSWKLTLISICTIPLLLIATNIFKNAIKKTFNDVRNQVARLNTFVQERITGIAIVKIFNRESEDFEQFKAINREHRKAHIRSVWYYSVFFPIVDIYRPFRWDCSFGLGQARCFKTK
jgi:ATP-binding cassette subfamily B protein